MYISSETDALPPLSERIRRFRESKGWTQAVLAESVGVSAITVIRWENGSSRPSTLASEQLVKIGLGPIRREETKAFSNPNVGRSPQDLERWLPSTVDHGELSRRVVYPSYVSQAPDDQLPFLTELIQMQSLSTKHERRSWEGLSLIKSVDGITTAQSKLESPTASARSWSSNYGTHGLHRYVGKFPPHLVRSLANHFELKRGAHIIDPFVGSGTTMVEARLLGFRGTGIEISPLSALISRVKSEFPEPIETVASELSVLGDRFEQRFRDFVNRDAGADYDHKAVFERDGNSVQPFVNAERWFTPEALLGVSIIVELLDGFTGYTRDLLAVCLSAQMRSIGNVDVDVVRAEYRKTPRENVDVLGLVRRKLSSAIRAIEKSLQTHSALIGSPQSVSTKLGSLLDVEIEPKSADAIITSPPYGAESLSYIRTHLLSFRSLQGALGSDEWLSGVIGSEFVSKGNVPEVIESASNYSATYRRFFGEISSEVMATDVRRLAMTKQFFSDMTESISKMSQWLKVGGGMAFVIGNKRLANRLIPTHEILAELFETHGLKMDRVISHKLKSNNSNSEVPWQERAIQEEYILIARRR